MSRQTSTGSLKRASLLPGDRRDLQDYRPGVENRAAEQEAQRDVALRESGENIWWPRH